MNAWPRRVGFDHAASQATRGYGVIWSAMQHDNQTETDREYEARARLLATRAGRASDASIAIAQWQLARCYALLARWRRQRRSDPVDTNEQS